MEDWQPTLANRLWRAHSDAVDSRLLDRWLPRSCGTVLKTDLFDEAVAPGLYSKLAARAQRVVGVDISPATVRAAAARHPGLEAHLGSVLALPFPDHSVDMVVSNSTLDHFERRPVLRAAVAELARVTVPGAELIITLDNRSNPIITLWTSRLLSSLHRRLRIVPYYVGSTCGAHGLSKLLRASGFEVEEMTAIMHCPPQVAAKLAERTRGRRSEDELQQAHLRRVMRWETLERYSSRHVTGHFVAARAIRGQSQASARPQWLAPQALAPGTALER